MDGSACHLQDGSRYKYRSTSRVLIVGSGADEQCAGYGRHRTKYRLGGYLYSSFLFIRCIITARILLMFLNVF